MRPAASALLRAASILTVLAVAQVVPPIAGASHPAIAAQAVRAHRMQASNSPPVLLLMDVSTSMDESDGSGQAKLDGARTAALDFVSFIRDTAPETRIGLNAYPADRQCGGGRSSIPINTASTQAMDRVIRSLSSEDGGTPTAAALEKAGEDLDRAGGSGVIVLVSDGESNCDRDPCEVAKNLAAKGTDVTVNTIGFRINDSGRAELQCIADATGGTYVDVTDSSELQDQFKARAVADLTATVSAPRSVSVRPGAANTTAINLSVENQSPTDGPVASNVEATLTFDARFSPGSAQPRRRLGNLRPGASWATAWQIRPSDEFIDQTVSYTVRVFSPGLATLEQKGSITFRADTSLAGVPTWMTGVDHIVVMGDSYSSGEGAGSAPKAEGAAFDKPTDEPYNTCHRSDAYNYGGQLAKRLGSATNVTTLACSGAVADDFWLDSKAVRPNDYQRVNGRQGGASLPGQLKQLEQLKDAPDLIILTVGGNDAGFEDLAVLCLLPNCEDPGPLLPKGRDKLRTGLERMTPKLSTVYRSVTRVAAERARHPVPVLVLSYPVPFPADGRSCARTDLHFGSNHGFLNRVAAEINTRIDAEVNRVHEEGQPIWFIDVADLYQDGHTYCDKVPWVNPASNAAVTAAFAARAADTKARAKAKLLDLYLALRFGLAPRKEYQPADRIRGFQNMLHPNRAGYKAEAQVILDWARNHPQLATPVPDDATVVPATRGASVPSGPVIALGESGQISIQPGAGMTLTANGFAPGSPVEFFLESTPEPVALGFADTKGQAAQGFVLREDFPIGAHHLVARGLDPEGRPLEVRRATTVERALPWWWLPAVGAAVASLAGALVLGLLARHRRRNPNRVPTGHGSAGRPRRGRRTKPHPTPSAA